MGLLSDIFVDQREKLFEDLGISQETRQIAQEAVQEAKSLLPPGGEIPHASAGNASKPQATGWALNMSSNTLYVAGAAILLVGAYFIFSKGSK